MLENIGNTPLARLRKIPPSNSAEIFLKIEGVNPTRSYKVRMARRLAREEGIFAGTSTGLSVVAALQLAEEIGRGSIVVTAACDTDSSTSMEHGTVTIRTEPEK